MPEVRLEQFAHARSGDKGTGSNVGVLACNPVAFQWLRQHLTADLVKELLGGFVKGPVERYELPNLMGFNFLLHDSLGGGGSSSLLTDAQGKTHGQSLLRCTVSMADSDWERIVVAGGVDSTG